MGTVSEKQEELVAFEYGFLGRSGGGTPAEELGGLLEFLGSGAIGVSHGEMKKGEGWASATIRFPLPDEALLTRAT